MPENTEPKLAPFNAPRQAPKNISRAVLIALVSFAVGAVAAFYIWGLGPVPPPLPCPPPPTVVVLPNAGGPAPTTAVVMMENGYQCNLEVMASQAQLSLRNGSATDEIIVRQGGNIVQQGPTVSVGEGTYTFAVNAGSGSVRQIQITANM